MESDAGGWGHWGVQAVSGWSEVANDLRYETNFIQLYKETRQVCDKQHRAMGY